MRIFLRPVVLLIAVVAAPLAGCGGSDGADSLSRPVLPVAATTPHEGGSSSSQLAGLPATFFGVLPCPECSGIEYHLNLFADRTYFLRTSYVGQSPEAEDDLGRWGLGSDGETLILTGDRGAPQYFSVVNGTTLRQLDASARPLISGRSHDLKRAGSFRTLEVQATLRGSYVTMMDTGMFTDCSTQRRWLVAGEGGSTELAGIYHERGLGAGESLIVSVQGTVAQRPAQTGEGTADVLVVDHVIGASPPGTTCPPSRDTASLEGTRWRLTSVGGQDVIPTPGRTAPAVLTLGWDSAEFSGSTGCNQTLGSFQRDGRKLSFARTVTTRMECPDDLAADEAFVRALEEVARWRIIGRILELTDGDGGVLARFEAA